MLDTLVAVPNSGSYVNGVRIQLHRGIVADPAATAATRAVPASHVGEAFAASLGYRSNAALHAYLQRASAPGSVSEWMTANASLFARRLSELSKGAVPEEISDRVFRAWRAAEQRAPAIPVPQHVHDAFAARMADPIGSRPSKGSLEASVAVNEAGDQRDLARVVSAAEREADLALLGATPTSGSREAVVRFWCKNCPGLSDEERAIHLEEALAVRRDTVFERRARSLLRMSVAILAWMEMHDGVQMRPDVLSDILSLNAVYDLAVYQRFVFHDRAAGVSRNVDVLGVKDALVQPFIEYLGSLGWRGGEILGQQGMAVQEQHSYVVMHVSPHLLARLAAGQAEKVLDTYIFPRIAEVQ